jgi:hypothetical protein
VTTLQYIKNKQQEQNKRLSLDSGIAGNDDNSNDDQLTEGALEQT